MKERDFQDGTFYKVEIKTRPSKYIHYILSKKLLSDTFHQQTSQSTVDSFSIYYEMYYSIPEDHYNMIMN